MKQNFYKTLRQYWSLAAAFIICFLLLRVYEVVSVESKVTGEEFLFSELVGFLNDARIGLIIALAFSIPALIVGFTKPNISFWFTAISFAVLITASFCLVQYYSITLVPLSSDFYGYSLKDLALTIRSSGGVSIIPATIVLALVSILIILNRIFNGRKLFNSPQPKLYRPSIVLGLILLAFGPFKASGDHQDLSASKAGYFIDKSLSFLISNDDNVVENGKNNFPFLHEVNYSNALIQYLEPQQQYPNIVFILVEGLGRDFVGNGAKWKGFTPFLDFLTEQSLYWENMLSNSGRTFGVLPSILAGLPYGKAGVLAYGQKMPKHQSLLTLLKPLGYQSHFFHGGNSNFDNQDLFLEMNGIDLLIDESKYPIQYQKMKSDKNGFSWGFGDRDVFNYSLEVLAETKQQNPRIDIYLTLSTHEPFEVPEERFKLEFESRLHQLDVDDDKRETYANHRNIFECLSYTDDAIKEFFAKYKNRDDYDKTIFIITGDHRLIPIEQDSRIDRFHVPLIVYSPHLEKPEKFSSANVHASVTPTLLGWFSKSYQAEFPKEMPFIAGPLSFETSFSSNLDLALIRNKNETIDYIQGASFLSNDVLYQIQPGLVLKTVNNPHLKEKLQRKLSEFKSNGLFALNNDRLDKSGSSMELLVSGFSDTESQFIKENNLARKAPDKLFEEARDLARLSQYNESRIILKYLLNGSPNYHDARIFLARTFGWEGQYDSARIYLQQARQRDSGNTDLYAAWADVEYWAGQHSQSLALIREGLNYDSLNNELLARKARILFLNGEIIEAAKLTQRVLQADSTNEIATELTKKL